MARLLPLLTGPAVLGLSILALAGCGVSVRASSLPAPTPVIASDLGACVVGREPRAVIELFPTPPGATYSLTVTRGRPPGPDVLVAVFDHREDQGAFLRGWPGTDPLTGQSAQPVGPAVLISSLPAGDPLRIAVIGCLTG